MIKTIRKILSKVLIAILAIVLVTPGMAETTSNIHPDIGDFGAWATDANRELFIGEISNDIEQFQGNLSATTSNNFVPIEAKVGLAFINALSFISGVLEISFVRFVKTFCTNHRCCICAVCTTKIQTQKQANRHITPTIHNNFV